MKGKHRIIVQNNRLRFDFTIKRNLTILRGDSATGKTTLMNLIRQAANLGTDSGVEIHCDVECLPLEGRDWKLILRNYRNCIFFSDEENAFIRTEEFAKEIQGKDSYFVLITRENLYNLPYSVEEIYGIHSSGKYQTTQRVYEELYRIYPPQSGPAERPELMITEDSGAGFDFFSAVCREINLPCISANGKSKIYSALKNNTGKKIVVIADGAAIGCEMDRIGKKIRENGQSFLFLPESFEWLLLKSGMIDGKRIQGILDQPEDFIDSQQYISWERYFTKLLTEETQDTYLHYEKRSLNKNYLLRQIRNAVLSAMEGMKDFLR